MNGHDRYRLLLAASLDEVLAPADERELSAHLPACALCRAESVALRRDHYWLAEPAPVATSPAVRSAVARAARTGSTGGASRGWILAAAAAFVVAVGAIGTVGVLRSVPPGPGHGVVPPSDRPSPSVPPTPSSMLVPGADLTGSGSGRLFEQSSDSTVGRITASVRGRYGEATGFIDVVLDPPGESWRGTVHYADYWYDASGEWYVAFVEGCRDGPGCESFVLQLVDGRARTDRTDEVSLAWTTLEGFDFSQDWQTWYRIDGGNLVVPNVP